MLTLRKMQAKAREATDAVATRASDAAVWAMCNPNRAMAIGGALLAAAMVVVFLAEPESAEAYAPLVAALLVVIGGIGVGVAIDAATDKIEEMLKPAVQGIIAATQDLIGNTANGRLLEGTFTSLLGDDGVYNMLYNIHHSVFIPLANVIVAIFFVLGLVKLVSKAGQTDGGIDTWQLVWLFVMFVLTMAVVQASWEIMALMFNMSQWLIEHIIVEGTMATDISDPTDGVENAGALIVMLLVASLGYIVALVISLLSTIVVFIRALQIYLYTVASPIPIAFMTSESGREMTKSFLKRYIALLLTGAIMALIFMIFAQMQGMFQPPPVEISDVSDLGLWLASYGFNFMTYIAFGWALLHSSQWAKDLVGV